MAVGKSPAFRFYASDFLGSPDVQMMDNAERGVFITLLCVAWQSDRHGYLPDDENKIRRWARMSQEQWLQSREIILAQFPVVEADWRANLGLIEASEKQQVYRESQSKKGKLGGRPKKAGALAETKPGVSGEKPELSSGISPRKPSVSASASVSVSDTGSAKDNNKGNNISLASQAHPGASRGDARVQELIQAQKIFEEIIRDAPMSTGTQQKQKPSRPRAKKRSSYSVANYY
jgi:uncharacterized protein YdaU (DUF1376 family)